MVVFHFNKPFIKENDNQQLGRLLVHTFGVAAAYAKRLYGVIIMLKRISSILLDLNWISYFILVFIFLFEWAERRDWSSWTADDQRYSNRQPEFQLWLFAVAFTQPGRGRRSGKERGLASRTAILVSQVRLRWWQTSPRRLQPQSLRDAHGCVLEFHFELIPPDWLILPFIKHGKALMYREPCRVVRLCDVYGILYENKEPERRDFWLLVTSFLFCFFYLSPLLDC